MPATDVLVVGAGPVGLGLGCGLLAHGIPVRVIDKAAAPATTSRANFLHARGSEVLDRLGALGDLPERSVRAMKITTRLYAELRGRWAVVLPDGADAALVETTRKHLGDRMVSIRRDDPADADALLVRPDGHLAWRRRRSASLDRWLRRVLETGRVR